MEETRVDVRGGLAGAFVHLVGAPPGALPTEPVRLRTVRGVLEPAVVVVAPGQAVEWTNADPVVHTVHASGARPTGQFSLRPPTDRGLLVFDEDGPHRIRCDVHPWESAWAWVARDPAWALSGPDGAFVLPPVPPGRYRLEVRHPACAPAAVDVDLPGAAGDVALRLR